MAVTLVQKATNNNFGATTLTVTFAAATTPGNAILVGFTWGGTAGTTTGTTFTVADNAAGGGNAYTVDASSRSAVGPTAHYPEIGAQHAYSLATAAATAVTLTASQSVYIEATAWEVTPCQRDGSSSGTATSASGACASRTPSANGAFGTAAAYIDDGLGLGNIGTAGSGYTLDLSGGGGNSEYGSEHVAQAAAAALTGAFAFPASGQWVDSQLIMVPTGAATPVLPPRLVTWPQAMFRSAYR